MHKKEQVIQPPFFHLLKLQTITTKIDTDLLGTFSGEVEREDCPSTCARKKCEQAMEAAKTTIGIASEGSFVPHPFIPFVNCDHEILCFVDKEHDFILYQSLLSTKTNYSGEVCSDFQQLKKLCDRALFPSHALIVRPNKSSQKKLITKGIQSYEMLEEVFAESCRISEDGSAFVQTDMRAHMNPTRMELIKQLAESTAKRLATPCPACLTPGWGVVDVVKGLECEACGSETQMIRYEILRCSKCLYQENRQRIDGLLFADPQYCHWCNP